jgi:GLPGLI family protein
MDKKKKIAGYTCKLAKIIVNEDHTATIHIWYTEDLPQAYWGEYAYLKNIPGAALEISTSGIGIQAYRIKPDGDVNLFKIPSDFSEIKALN